MNPRELVERIWAHDPTVWTGRDEAHWLGWLDEPARMRERLGELHEVAAEVDADAVVLLGMGGSSLAPEVLRQRFGASSFHVLDTTHPQAIRRLADELDPDRTLFVSASKSGSTLETRSHTDFFWEWCSHRGDRFLAVTDPGSSLAQLAVERGFRHVFHGEPTIGGRYSALSAFGLVPAALMGLDPGRLLDRADEMGQACRLADANPGLELGLELGEGWAEGRDKVLLTGSPGGFGLWVEQLLAESTGKQGKGLVPVVHAGAGGDVQEHESSLADPYDLGGEFFRWEFATAVAGSLLGINPFDQPNVQEAKDNTQRVLGEGSPELEPGDLDALRSSLEPPRYAAIMAYLPYSDQVEAGAARLRERFVTASRVATTFGYGPRFLHSTGQFHKGGPAVGAFVQVVDEPQEDVEVPGEPYTFGTLIRAQADGDLQTLRSHGLDAVRIGKEEL